MSKEIDTGPRGTVAFVSLEIYPATAGGTGILVYNTIRSLLARGYKVLLVLDVQRPEYERFDQVHRLDLENAHNLHVYLVEDLYDGKDLKDVVFAHQEVRRAARIHFAMEELKRLHDDIDLIEYYDYCGPAYYALTSPNPVPVGVRLHNTVEFIARKIRAALESERIIQFGQERTCLQGADILLSPGRFYYEEDLVPLYDEVEEERMELSPPVHYPVGQITYDNLSKNIVFYGRLSTFKGLDTFIRGAVLALQDPDFARWLGSFWIIGPEETVASALSLEDVKALIPDELIDRFEFVGRVRHDELMERLSATAFACFANRAESFCYAAHEIHTAGVPLIVSDTPAFRDHFEDGETAIFFDRSSVDLSRAMIRLSQDYGMRAKLSANGTKRADAYDAEDHYASHIGHCKKRQRPEGEALPSTTVFVLSDGRAALDERTLRSAGDAEVIILRTDPEGRAHFGGLRWTATDGRGRSVNLDLEESNATAVFLRSGDVLDVEWLSDARRLMARRSDVGAVGGWLRRGSRLIAGTHNILPETGIGIEPGLRTLIRFLPNLTYQEALRRWSDDSEVSWLLSHRREGRIILELPRLAVDVTHAIPLPPSNSESLLLVDFDRMRKDFLASASPLLSTVSELENRIATFDEDAQLIAESASNPSLAVLRVVADVEERPVMLLRFFRSQGRMCEPWSSVHRTGDWQLVHDRFGPVEGALQSSNGQLRLYVNEGARLDLLRSYASGAIDIFYRGFRYHFDLSTDGVDDLALNFGETIEAEEQGARAVKIEDAAILSGRHASLMARRKIKTAFIAESDQDFIDWPQVTSPDSGVFHASEFAFFKSTADASNLQAFVKGLGVERLVFSTRVNITRSLKKSLSQIGGKVSYAVALCGGRESERSPSAVRFEAYAAWYKFIKESGLEFTVFGGPRGALELFKARGVSTVHLPSPLSPLPSTGHNSGALHLAALPARSIERNVMHMVNAAILARHKGVDIASLWLPASYRDLVVLDNELNLDIDVQWYDSLLDLEEAGQGKSIAMACYPDEEWPQELNVAARFGWLPLAGATSEMDDDDVLSAAITVPYWEDSVAIAERLAGIAGSYDDLVARYGAQVETRNTKLAGRMGDLLSPSEATLETD